MKSESAWVRPTAASVTLRRIAATMISITMAVVRMAPSMASRSIWKLGERLAAARISEATTPSEAASVGVARPA